MALNIPMPDLPGNALLKGLNTGSALFSRYMQPVLERERNAQQAQQFGANLNQRQKEFGENLTQRQLERKQQQEQFMQGLALRKQAESRMGALLPLQKMQLQLALQKAERESDPMKQLAYYNAIRQGLSQQNTTSLPEQSPSMNLFGGNGMPSLNEMQNPTINPPSKQQLQQGFQTGQSQGPSEADQLAYQLTFGKNMPKPYESPKQKLQNDINKAITIDEAKAKRKELGDIKTDASSLLKAAGHLEAIEKLLMNNPNRTGALAGRLSNAPLLNNLFDSKTINALNAHAVPLQAEIAGQLSKGRGGYGVAKIAEIAKPSSNMNQEGNIGALLANKEAVLESLKMMKQEYENAGLNFPYKIPDFLSKNPFEASVKQQQENSKPKRLKYNPQTGRLE